MEYWMKTDLCLWTVFGLCCWQCRHVLIPKIWGEMWNCEQIWWQYFVIQIACAYLLPAKKNHKKYECSLILRFLLHFTRMVGKFNHILWRENHISSEYFNLLRWHEITIFSSWWRWRWRWRKLHFSKHLDTNNMEYIHFDLELGTFIKSPESVRSLKYIKYRISLIYSYKTMSFTFVDQCAKQRTLLILNQPKLQASLVRFR